MINPFAVRFLIRVLFLGLCLFQFYITSFSQIIPVGSTTDMAARSLQLMGELDSSVSFTIRPLVSYPGISSSPFYSVLSGDSGVKYSQPVSFAKGKGAFQILPLVLQQQLNTHHPYGWNDGSMIAANGYQAQVSAGVYAGMGPLEIQLQPEFVYAANTHYETNADYGVTDPASYVRIFPGQSSVKLSFGAVSAGISSQNIWWGPGVRSSLLMSNNAPGFIHGFFSSKRPVKTGIGSFEWQLIGAKLSSDNTRSYENFNLQVRSLTGSARYLSAYVISYQPKWVPGVFVGMTRSLQRYRKDIDLSHSFLDKYIPVITKPFQKANAQGDDTLRTDQLASFFIRWVLLKAHAEFYVEYGFNDYNQNTRDYVMSPFHSAAYIAGFKKVVPLDTKKYIDFGFEITQMTQTPDHLVRSAGNWYEHGQVVQGYTHNNQILGNGAGMGCNVQSLTATWVNGWKQLGILLEHVERDPLNHVNKWNDYSMGVVPQLKHQNILFSGLFQFIHSSNYAWEKNTNRFNLHTRITVQYFF